MAVARSRLVRWIAGSRAAGRVPTRLLTEDEIAAFRRDGFVTVPAITTAEELDTLLVFEPTEKYGWGGRVAVGHISKLASMKQADLDKVAKRMADAGVAATVLTATDFPDPDGPYEPAKIGSIDGDGAVVVTVTAMKSPIRP